MKRIKEEVRWIHEGRQREAVTKALSKPMTGKEIFERSQEWAPKIQVRDVWFVLQQFREKDLAYCLTPQLKTGTLYFLTKRGRAVVASEFGLKVKDLPNDLDWMRYAKVVRARVRRLVLEEMVRPCRNGDQGKGASEIRKRLIERRPKLGLNATLRALADLKKLRLARCVGAVDDRRTKLYVLTPMGQRIVEQLQG